VVLRRSVGSIDDGIPPYRAGAVLRRDPAAAAPAWETGCVLDADPRGRRPVLNVKAPLALAAGVAAVLIPIAGVVAVSLGLLAVRDIRRDGGRGLGQAIGGVALGVVALVLLVLVLSGVIDSPD
jgi:hypothetical protein